MAVESHVAYHDASAIHGDDRRSVQLLPRLQIRVLKTIPFQKFSRYTGITDSVVVRYTIPYINRI